MKILIVEDEDLAVKKLQKTLALVDASAVVVGVTDSIKTTVEWLQGNPSPDLILMDIRLPGAQGNGWTAAKIIRNDPKLSHIPIIILTAGTMSTSKEEEQRYEAYIQKPFHVRDMLECIRAYLI